MKKTLFSIACILSITLFSYYISGRAAKVTHGFASYYTFSRLLLDDKDFSRSYDTAYFNLKINEFGIVGVRDLPNNIPTSSIIYAPVACFQPVTAKIIWTVISVLLYLISMWLLLTAFDIKLSSINGLISVIISFLFLPVYHGIELGQAYVFFLFLFSLSLYGFKKDNLLLISLPLAIMLILKGYGVLPLIFLALIKKWKMFLSVLLISIIITAITIPLTGIDAWDIYLKDVLLKMGGNEYSSYTSYQTMNSFVKHIFYPRSPILSSSIIFILALLFVYLIMRNKEKAETNILLIYASFAGLNVIFAPLAEDYHYALFLPLIFGIAKITVNYYRIIKVETVLFVISLMLVSVPTNYKTLNDASFPLILLAYPRFYGGILLILLTILLKNKRGFSESALSREMETAQSQAFV